jgi:hypothetical protein
MFYSTDIISTTVVKDHISIFYIAAREIYIKLLGVTARVTFNCVTITKFNF